MNLQGAAASQYRPLHASEKGRTCSSRSRDSRLSDVRCVCPAVSRVLCVVCLPLQCDIKT
jgi:hypothetical protein